MMSKWPSLTEEYDFEFEEGDFESFEINGDIDINNISFGYDSGKEVLHKIDSLGLKLLPSEE